MAVSLGQWIRGEAVVAICFSLETLLQEFFLRTYKSSFINVSSQKSLVQTTSISMWFDVTKIEQLLIYYYYSSKHPRSYQKNN